MSGQPPVCGANVAMPARLVGCGKPILTWREVYRCTHCEVAFHKDCANRHFLDDQILTEAMIDSITDQELADLPKVNP